ncbi:C5a anaphylatoxin chemotactic receptor 1 [Dromiciops gliroides]|uniref:C5a anaphylatoxin chemotactic receptor 1 n=1 Tax=Dromiciops gliroides TaxID=33562 RepID=UPI001CC4F895|nr:C5a anaphylatoxin chemotactic receptor 1 [Dromiciops gliroides]
MELSTLFPTDYPDYENWTSGYPVDGVREYTASEVISLLIFSMVFLVGVPGNMVVLWVTGIETHKMVNSIWFLNLAVADLFCCLVLPLLAVPVIRHGDWPFSHAACHFLPSVILFNMYASVLLLTVISIDRYILVTEPIWCQNHRSVCMAWYACAGAWIGAFLLTIPSLIFRQLMEQHFPHSWSCGVDYNGETVELIVTFSRFLFAFLCPLVIISICYNLLLSRLWRREATRSRKTVKVVIAVVVGFFICWTPYHIVGVLKVLIPRNSAFYFQIENIDSFTIALAYVNSCINPIIYVVAGHGIKSRMERHSLCAKLRNALAEDSVGRDSKSFTQSTVGSTTLPEEQV